MNQIKDPPNEYNAGLDFNYANWAAGTRLTLVNVPWNNDYRDIVKFADKAALNAYINDREHTGIVIEHVSPVKPNQPIRIDTPFNSAIRFNYLRASNPLMPVSGDVQRDFYYFITGVNYIAPNTTEVTIQLDIWQTFGFDVTFGNSYIERGHIGIANENAFDSFGRDWLTIPEGIEYGGEYRVIARKHESIIKTNTVAPGGEQYPYLDANVLVVSTTDLLKDPGNKDDPVLNTAPGSTFENLVSGASYYMWDRPGSFNGWMGANSSKPWMTQGIISITLVPKLSRYQAGYVDSPNDIIPTKVQNYRPGMVKTSLHNNWRNSAEILNKIPARYRHLKKFLTYPYMVIEMTTWTGSPILLKPESWADANATIIERATFTAPNQRVEIRPLRYNALPDSVIDNHGHLSNTEANDSSSNTGLRAHGIWIGAGDDGGEFIDLATKIANFPTMAVVNNGAIGYLASNAHGIAFQHNSADWSQTRALRSNEVSYDQQSAGIEMSKNINALDRAGMAAMTASNQQAMLEGVAVNGAAGVASSGIGMLGGGVSGGMSGIAAGGTGVVGAVFNQAMGGVNAGISLNQSNRNLNTATQVSAGTNAAQNNQAALLRDTNKSLADWSANGDYENSIAGINAKVQDAHLIQPTTSGQMGGETMNLVNGGLEVSLRWRMIDEAAIRTVGEYWLRFGYAVRKFAVIPADLMVMTKFTYWKLSETYVTSAPMPEFFKQAIRGIFEKGVTVWADPNDIGNIDYADNAPLDGIVL